MSNLRRQMDRSRLSHDVEGVMEQQALSRSQERRLDAHTKATEALAAAATTEAVSDKDKIIAGLRARIAELEAGAGKAKKANADRVKRWRSKKP